MSLKPVDASAFNDLAAKTLQGELPFGRVFTPHMVSIAWDEGKGWHDAALGRREVLSMDPAAMVLHYGQETFEGLKAHRQDSGRVILFRPEANAERLVKSCERLCMPGLPVDQFVDACVALTHTEQAWVPSREGASLYLRPTMIAMEPALGVRPAGRYLFYVLATATGPYFSKGFSGIRVMVERHMVRAAPGGLGSAKTGANYVASLLSAVQAKKQGCEQVLWLDAIEHKFIEETGASNVFWIEKGVLHTPPVSDTILRGITRDSLVRLAPEIGVRVQERRISIDELLAGIASGAITEMFGSGTAAVVSPISEILCDEKVVKIGSGEPGPISTKLLKAIVDIQRGRQADPFGWCKTVVEAK